MCLHDHASAPMPQTKLPRRGILAGAAALAGISVATITAQLGGAPAAHAGGKPSGPNYPGSPLTHPPLIIEGGTLVDPETGGQFLSILHALGCLSGAGVRGRRPAGDGPRRSKLAGIPHAGPSPATAHFGPSVVPAGPPTPAGAGRACHLAGSRACGKRPAP